MNHLLKLNNILESLGLKKEAKKINEIGESSYIKVAMLTDDNISEGLQYHIDNNIPLVEPVYRLFSEAHLKLLVEARTLYKQGKLIVDDDSEWMLTNDLGVFAEYEGEIVPLEFPMEIEKEASILKLAAEYQGKKVQLGKPRALRKGEPGHGRKNYVVYVKDGDRVKRITFGDPKLGQRPKNPAARKSFRARHRCDKKKDRTTPGYWACRYPPGW
jgi:hypothetical protein